MKNQIKAPKYITDKLRAYNSQCKVFRTKVVALEKERQRLIAKREEIERICARHNPPYTLSFQQ